MTPQTSDVAFRERRSDRLVIRRFRAEDAASLAAYRSDPATARYQSWDVPFSHAHARCAEGGTPDPCPRDHPARPGVKVEPPQPPAGRLTIPAVGAGGEEVRP